MNSFFLFFILANLTMANALAVAPGDTVYLNEEFKVNGVTLPEKGKVEIVSSAPDLVRGGRTYVVKDGRGAVHTVWEDPSRPGIFSLSHAAKASNEVSEYVYINSHGYPLKSKEDFRSGQNIAFTAAEGSVFAVLKTVPYPTGRGLLVRDDSTGSQYWMFDSNLQGRESQLISCAKSDCKDVVQSVPRALEFLNGKVPCEIAGADKAPMLRNPPAAKDKPRGEAWFDDSALVRPPNRGQAPAVSSPINYSGACIPFPETLSKPNFSAMKKNEQRKREFVKYVLPYAKLVQENTGLPTSVIIAQAALETGWGQSDGYNQRNAMFGHSCWSLGRSSSYRLQLDGRIISGRGRCSTPRPEGGSYLSFGSPQESIYAYAANLLGTNGSRKLYPGVIRAVNQVQPPQAADVNQVIDGLWAYAASHGVYQRDLHNLIRKNALTKFDVQPLCRKAK